jgi:flagellar basal body-associated protein FliL
MRSALKPSGLARLIRHLGPLVAVTFALSIGEARAADAPPAQGGGAQHKSTSSESYVIIDPIYSTILDGGKPRGLLMVELGLDVPDAKFRANVSKALPVLRDAYVRGLVTYASTAVRPYRQPNVEDIALRLQTITDKVMGKQGAKVLMAQTAIRITR